VPQSPEGMGTLNYMQGEMEERLQKLLAFAGYGSRRACEGIIEEGRVIVNDRVAELGQKADPAIDHILVDGKPVRTDRPHTYVIIHKPLGVLSDERDGESRFPTVRALVPLSGHLYPVGRLDLRSEGLVLLTDDGELANVLTHPRYEHTKEYRACVEGHPTEETLDKWRLGVFLDGTRTAMADVTVMEREPKHTWLRIVLREGRKRQIRRIGAMLGHPVRRLVRVRIGPIQLGTLRPGEWRHLREGEVKQLIEIREQKQPRHGAKKHRLHRD
jgi:23S rRNA pseudouridine2605 synthase